MTRLECKELFEPWFKQITNIHLHAIALMAFDELPDYFFVKPASSTGKYHPKFANGEGGLVRHTLYMLEVWKYLYKGFEKVLNYPNAYSFGIIACMFHDALKYGEPDENREYTTITHAEDAANWIRKISYDYVDKNIISDYNKEISKDSIEQYLIQPMMHHMGPWSTYGIGTDLMSQLIFIADYVASQPTFEKEIFQCVNN